MIEKASLPEMEQKYAVVGLWMKDLSETSINKTKNMNISTSFALVSLRTNEMSAAILTQIASSSSSSQ